MFHHASKVALFLLCAAITTTSRAELPGSAYDDMKAKASDIVEIEVTRVSINTRDGENLRDISVYADARVVGVTRSKSRLKVGDQISLRYMTFEVLRRGWAGPGPILIVEKGKRYGAFLKKGGSHFYAAARGRSLEEK